MCQVLQASVPVMTKEGGSIVLATAAISHMGAANHDIVAAAKGAVSSLAVSAAATYSAHNIRYWCLSTAMAWSRHRKEHVNEQAQMCW